MVLPQLMLTCIGQARDLILRSISPDVYAAVIGTFAQMAPAADRRSLSHPHHPPPQRSCTRAGAAQITLLGHP
jgi:hypothetical protein